jgi:hypothetical protein
MMTADKDSALRIADEILKHARQTIDAEFGEHYARGHPGLVMTFVSGMFGLLTATVRRMP